MVLDAFWNNKRRPINERKSRVHGLRPTLFLQAAAVISIGTTSAITWAQPAPDANDPIALVDDAGAAAFHKKCAACHSIGGQGTGEDISFTLRVPESRLEQEIFNMEKFTGPLELEQIMDLIELMKSTEAANRLKTAKEQIVTKGGAVAEAAAAPVPAEIHPGGKAFAESCATCHNISGQGALTGTDISFTVHWKDDEIKNSIKKMEKYTGALPPEKVQALTELMKREDAAAQIKAAKGGAAVAQAPAAATAEAPTTATATPPAQTQSTAPMVADAPAKPAATEWIVTTATQANEQKPTAPQVAAAEATTDDPMAALFVNRCALCHTIGGGMTQGPDLASTRNKGFPIVEAAVRRMQMQAGPLEEPQIKGLTELITGADFKKRVDDVRAAKAAAAPPRQVAAAPKVEEADPEEQGMELFHGDAPFAKGGISCNACHSIGSLGGTAAPDLRFAYSKLGEEALLAIIRNADGKAIHPIYNEHKITEAEAKSLAAYLKDTSEHPPRANPSGIPVLAILGAMLTIGLLGYLFRPFPENDNRTAL